MPTAEENWQAWNEAYDWPRGGDEWSRVWGGVDAQWHGSILQRIHAFVPTGTILEIAPGFGRWSRFLKDLCTSLVLVDLSERCIDACRRRFADERHVAYHVNDGRTLEMLEDGSIDFAFSFDSLVHAELDVLEAYLGQLARKLAPGGVGFLHHSNLASFADEGQPVPENPHWRAASVSARRVRDRSEQYGLACPSQELVNWGCEYLSDAFTVVTPAGSRWEGVPRLRENPHFMREAQLVRAAAELYGRWSE